MLERKPHVLLVVFLVALSAMNLWRLQAWGVEGFVRYFSDPIVQTTWFDFGCVLAILLVFIHRDAKAHGLSYWWIVPTFPFMPTVGFLAYFIVRRRALLAKGAPLVAVLVAVVCSTACATRPLAHMGPVPRPDDRRPRTEMVIGTTPASSERAVALAKLLRDVCVASVVTEQGLFCESEPRCQEGPVTTLVDETRTVISCDTERGSVLARFDQVKHVKLEWRRPDQAPCVIVDVERDVARAKRTMPARFCHASPQEREKAEMTWRLLSQIADAPFDTIE